MLHIMYSKIRISQPFMEITLLIGRNEAPPSNLYYILRMVAADSLESVFLCLGTKRELLF